MPAIGALGKNKLNKERLSVCISHKPQGICVFYLYVNKYKKSVAPPKKILRPDPELA